MTLDQEEAASDKRRNLYSPRTRMCHMLGAYLWCLPFDQLFPSHRPLTDEEAALWINITQNAAMDLMQEGRNVEKGVPGRPYRHSEKI